MFKHNFEKHGFEKEKDYEAFIALAKAAQDFNSNIDQAWLKYDEVFKRQSYSTCLGTFKQSVEKIAGLGLIETMAWDYKLTPKGLKMYNKIKGA